MWFPSNAWQLAVLGTAQQQQQAQPAPGTDQQASSWRGLGGSSSSSSGLWSAAAACHRQARRHLQPGKGLHNRGAAKQRTLPTRVGVLPASASVFCLWLTLVPPCSAAAAAAVRLVEDTAWHPVMPTEMAKWSPMQKTLYQVRRGLRGG